MNNLITFVFVMTIISCTPSVIVEVEPGETVEIIVVEPKERWDWRSREKARRIEEKEKYKPRTKDDLGKNKEK